MSIECSTCSLSALKGAIPKVKPENRGPRQRFSGEPVSRNIRELVSASLHYLRVANLPERMKPVMFGQATLVCSRSALRGDWRQRAGKEKSRNLGGPCVSVKFGSPTLDKTSASGRRPIAPHVGVGRSHSSWEGLNPPGAKGIDCKRVTITN